MQDGGFVHQAMRYLVPKSGHGPGVDEDPEWHPEKLMPGQCIFTHGFCRRTDGSGTHVAQELRAAVAVAAALQDFAGLAQLVNLPAVAVVPERNAIQVIGCDGETVVGHVPVPLQVLIELQAIQADRDE